MRFAFLLVSFLFSYNLIGQNVTFMASTDAKEVLEGNYFQITFKLNNARASEFIPPTFKDFKVLSGPSTSSQMTIINGRTSQSISYSYSLMPNAPGTYQISPASITVGGKTLKSNSVNVKVLKSEQQNTAASGADNEEEVFLEIELSDTAAYVGQQITLKYVIYTSVDVRSYNFINESEYNGFYVEDLQNYKDQAVRVVRGGRQYVKQTLKAVSLFPQQTGVADIGSSIVNLGIAIKSVRPSFFFSTSMRSKRIATKPISINILPSPKGAPISFSGGIGDFKMSCRFDKNSIPLDGAITMTMTIEGDGDSRFVSPPTQRIRSFETYEPNLLNENKRVVNGRIVFSKTYEYLMVPIQNGSFSLRPEFSYFDIDSSRFETIYSPNFGIRVLGGKRNQTISTEDIDNRLAPIFTSTTLRKSSWYDPVFSPAHIGFLSFCSLAFISLCGMRWRDIQQSKIDPSLLKSQKAQKVAIAKLSMAKSYLDNSEIREFYAELLDGVMSYLSDKLHIPTAQISKDTVDTLFADHHIPLQFAERISDLIQICEMAIYAGFTPERAQEDYELSKTLIVDIEDELKK